MRSTPDGVGDAARALATILHPHFVREEEIALPPPACSRLWRVVS